MPLEPSPSSPAGPPRGAEPARPAEKAEADDIRLAIAGDRGAFDRLVLSCQDDVVNASSYYLGNDEDGVDVAQEAFLKAYRGLAGFRGGSSFKTWVLRIAINTARSFRARARARKRGGGVLRLDDRPRGAGSEDDEPRQEPADPRPGITPPALLERKELKEAIERAILDLEDEAREVIVLRDIAGESYEAIAAALGAPLGTVKSRVHRARLELQRKLRPLL
jgi:RNA polymerase sigma-70 factor (ECF subfamily)